MVCADPPASVYEGSENFCLRLLGFGRSSGLHLRIRLDGEGRDVEHGSFE